MLELLTPKKVMVFDVIYVNGNSLMGQPLYVRKKVLAEIFQNRPNVMEQAPFRKVTQRQEVVSFFKEALATWEEGIMVKHVQSIYLPGERRRHAWLKIKPEYHQQLADLPSFILMGGDYGQGARRNILSTFVIGVRSGTTWVACGRVGNGFNLQEYKRLTDTLPWQPTPPKAQLASAVPYYHFGKDRPDVFLPPQQSVVVEVLASQLMKTGDVASGIALRFPRLARMREDQDCQSCTEREALEALYRQREGRPDVMAPAPRQAPVDVVQAVAQKAKEKRLFYLHQEDTPLRFCTLFF